MKASNNLPFLVAAHFSFSTIDSAQYGFYHHIVCDFILFPKHIPGDLCYVEP